MFGTGTVRRQAVSVLAAVKHNTQARGILRAAHETKGISFRTHGSSLPAQKRAAPFESAQTGPVRSCLQNISAASVVDHLVQSGAA